MISKMGGFAGAELVHDGAGLFRVYVSDPASVEAVRQVFAKDGIERVEVQLVEHSEHDLVNDIVLAWDALDRLGLRDHVGSISLQDDFDGIEVTVNSHRSIEAVDQSLTRAVRSNVEFTVEATPNETACSNRGNCTSPMRPGNRMERGSVNGPDCTMGFHVRSGSNEQYLTAGHCSYGSASKFWYHDGYGYVGDRKASAYGGSNSRDVMRVEMPDSQVSDDIYITASSTADIVGQFNTNQIYNGLPVCVSGEQSGVKCGSINDKWDTWTGAACGCTQWGSDTNYTTVGGDSGAPVYHQQWWSGYSQRVAYAVGISNTSGGHFTRIQDALSFLSVTLVT